jgi:hypothetical protein
MLACLEPARVSARGRPSRGPENLEERHHRQKLVLDLDRQSLELRVEIIRLWMIHGTASYSLRAILCP